MNMEGQNKKECLDNITRKNYPTRNLKWPSALRFHQSFTDFTTELHLLRLHFLKFLWPQRWLNPCRLSLPGLLGVLIAVRQSIFTYFCFNSLLPVSRAHYQIRLKLLSCRNSSYHMLSSNLHVTHQSFRCLQGSKTYKYGSLKEIQLGLDLKLFNSKNGKLLYRFTLGS